MKFGLFSFMHYTAPGRAFAGGTLAPKNYDAVESLKATNFNLELFDRADALGFDWVSVSEHHYSTAMTPNPIVAAAALSQRIKRADIAVLGPTLPLLNPVRTAEELAMLDNLCGGRLIVGLLRGTPLEYLTYGSNPAQSRAMFEEAVELMLRAWTEPESFGWEGIHYRFRTIAVSPGVIQKPWPRILVSGNSLEFLEFAARHRFDIGFSFADPLKAGKHFAVYKKKAEQYGWTPTEDNVLYRHYCYVAESDEVAAEDNERYRYFGSDAVFTAAPTRAEAIPETPRTVADALGAVLAQAGSWGAGGKSAIDFSIPPIVGSPDTVIRRLQELKDVASVGRVDLIFTAGQLPQELAIKSLTLFAKEIFPELQVATQPSTHAASA